MVILKGLQNLYRLSQVAQGPVRHAVVRRAPVRKPAVKKTVAKKAVRPIVRRR